MKIASKLLCSIWAITLLVMLNLALSVGASGMLISPIVYCEQMKVSITYDGASLPTFDYDSAYAYTNEEEHRSGRTGGFFAHFSELFAAKGGGEFVDLYRAVSPGEFADVFKIGGFRPAPGGTSLVGKQFGRNLDEVVKLADHLPDTAAVIRARIPRNVFNQLDHTSVDSFILRSGSTTVQPGQQNLFNSSIIELIHAF